MGRGQGSSVKEHQEPCQNLAVAEKHSVPTAETDRDETAMSGEENGLEISAHAFIRLSKETIRLSVPCGTGSERLWLVISYPAAYHG